MKKAHAAFLVLVTLTLCAGISYAAGTELVLAHTFTGQSKGDTAVTLQYSLHVRNTGAKPLRDVTLSLVPLPPLFADRQTVHVGNLGPREMKEVQLQVVARTHLYQPNFSGRPLLWAGRYVDAEGQTVEFGIGSKEGGAK